MINVRLTTAEAAARLGVKPETLYAYVSRGLVERQRDPGGASTFAARDIERLARAGRRTKNLPAIVFPSGLTRIADGRVAYRGVDAVQAALTHRFEEVAEWLWRGQWPEHTRWPFDPVALDLVLGAQAGLPSGCLPLDRFRVIAAVAGATDPVRHDARPEVVEATARRLLRLLAHGLPRADGREARRAEPARTMAEVLWTRSMRLPRTPARVDLLDAASRHAGRPRVGQLDSGGADGRDGQGRRVRGRRRGAQRDRRAASRRHLDGDRGDVA